VSRTQDAALEVARLKAQARGEGRTILAVDPGTAATGVALLVDGEPWLLTVIRARGVTAEERLPAMCHDVAAFVRRYLDETNVDTVALEWQAIRPGDKRPNDILHLSIVLGAALAGFRRDSAARLLTPLPAAWKGNTKPEIFDRRIREHYPTAAEKLHDVPAHLQHNAIDALGLASWAINRCLPWKSL
jgi:hypothetical protein